MLRLIFSSQTRTMVWLFELDSSVTHSQQTSCGLLEGPPPFLSSFTHLTRTTHTNDGVSSGTESYAFVQVR
jgi:hypothetical protein